MDKPELPQYDVRVRRALSMAIDRESIVKDYFRGYAEILSYPVIPLNEFKALGLYIPLEQQPKEVQEIFSYSPEKAKQLLAEAGYPKGFKISADVDSAEGGQVDYTSILKEYWAAIGVDLEIRVRDSAVFQSIKTNRTQEHMIWQALGSNNPYGFADTRGVSNRGNVNDPYINELAVEIGNLVYDEPARLKLYKEKAYSYLLEAVYSIVTPSPNIFIVRQPWLRNVDGGEEAIGTSRLYSFPAYVWIDQELKKSMGY